MVISHNSLLHATLAIYPLSQKYLITITQGFEDKGLGPSMLLVILESC